MAAYKSASTQKYFFVVEKDALCWAQPLQLLALCLVVLSIQSMFTYLVLSSQFSCQVSPRNAQVSDLKFLVYNSSSKSVSLNSTISLPIPTLNALCNISSYLASNWKLPVVICSERNPALMWEGL